MATIRIPEDQLTLLAGFTAASNGDLLSIAPGQYESTVPSWAKAVNIAGSGGKVELIRPPASGDYCLRYRAGSNGSTAKDVVFRGGAAIVLSIYTGLGISCEDCEIENPTPATYTAYVQGTLDFLRGKIEASGAAYAAIVLNGGNLYLDGTEITSTSTQRAIYATCGAAASALSLKNCVGLCAGGTFAQHLSVAGAVPSSVEYIGNVISHTNNGAPYTLGVGGESTSTGNAALNGYVIEDNQITGQRGLTGSASGIVHNIFVGHAVNGSICRNTIIGGGYALVWKGTGTANTTGHLSFNVAINPNIGLRVKGVNGAKICNNTITCGSTSGRAAYLTDNDGAGNSYNVIHKNNIYVQEKVGTEVVALDGAVSFAANSNNCYVLFDNTIAFKSGADAKTWAQWVTLTGETDSFFILKNGDAWDVYTSAAPTVVAWSLSACPIDATTGRIVNIAGNPLIKSGAVVSGVNDNSELDIWGNATLSASNIGADQYDYAPGFGPWTPFDATMPSLSLASTCPGKLKSVQEWRKVASAKEIERY